MYDILKHWYFLPNIPPPSPFLPCTHNYMGVRWQQKAEIKRIILANPQAQRERVAIYLSIENSTLENIPEIPTPQHSLNIAKSNNGPGAKGQEQRNKEISMLSHTESKDWGPEGRMDVLSRGRWLQEKCSSTRFHAVVLTTHILWNVAVNSERWENKGSLIKIKFLPSHWNEMKIKFREEK